MERPTHQRSKSARLLHRLRGGDASPRDSESESDSPLAQSNASLSALQLAPSEPSRSRLTPIRTASTGNEMEHTTSNLTLRTADQTSPPGLQDAVSSIEDSVRTFRIFEVLRSGDTAAIDKAITDTQSIPGTTILHLAIQCAEPPTVQHVIGKTEGKDVNTQDKDGNTPLHLAAHLGRAPIVKSLLSLPEVNDAIANHHGRFPIDLARTPDIFQELQLARSIFVDQAIKQVQRLVAQKDYKSIEKLLVEPRVEGALDVNTLELATDPLTMQSGGTLLHEAARQKDIQLAQILLMHGADPFRRDKRGKLPQDVTKDDRTRAILKKSPAAAVAQRGIQEKAILGSNPNQARSPDGAVSEAGKDSREMKGYLKKWTNYTSGYKLRWFVLEDGVLSYYKHQDDAGSACRGAINMRIARLHMDPQDKTRFEIHGKSSVKYHLKANHVVEAKRWFWSLNNAIQFTKDEAKEEEKRRTMDADKLKQAKIDAADNSDGLSLSSTRKHLPSTLGAPESVGKSARSTGRSTGDDGGSAYDSPEPSETGETLSLQHTHTAATTMMDGDGDDDASDDEIQAPTSKDAFNITAQSAKLQLDLLARVSGALKTEQTNNPSLKLSDPEVGQALATYETAVSSLSSMVADLLKIARDRDAYWQYRLDREADARKMWEDSMAKVAAEHEGLQRELETSEEKRKKTKRTLKETLEGQSLPPSRPGSRGPERAPTVQFTEALEQVPLNRDGRATTFGARRRSIGVRDGARRMSVIAQYTDLSDSESGDDDEFFDAVGAGEIKVMPAPLTSPLPAAVSIAAEPEVDPLRAVDERSMKQRQIQRSFVGYEDGVRKRLKMDADNRPKISLWGILKSMIGKDMTKMTLPVSFNEPTSLLQRVAEDMEYSDLLDIAADRPDSTERLVYVAAFAASEYTSTIGRVAKPFNPLLGETYEYVRPDKGYRFLVEQVSHHPPIGAAHAESARWDYWGESAVKSKFYGKSFDINPLGTWFLRLRPTGKSKSELYTWKKVTTSVVGIITGNPTVDNYGPMEIKNWSTGEVCLLDFKQRGWKASSAYQVAGKVVGNDGVTKWSIGGRWNDKIYARVTPGFEDEMVAAGNSGGAGSSADQAFLVWEANKRPLGIPFNLTPFVVTLNACPDRLRKVLPPTDTRLRPDQRAMEDGEYDKAATDKNRVEEKQRAARREREQAGEEWKPKWFEQQVDAVTGEKYWEMKRAGGYWEKRMKGDWSVCDDIF